MNYEELERVIKTKEKRGNTLFIVLSIVWILVTLSILIFSKRPFITELIINIVLTSLYFIYSLFYYFTVLREIKSYYSMFKTISNSLKEERSLEFIKCSIVTLEGLELNKYEFKDKSDEIELLSPFKIEFENKKYKVTTSGRFIREYYEEVF